MAGECKDFFISHAGSDRAWAEWVAWQLTGAGYTVELDVNWATGQNFVTAMSDALDRCERVVALFSAAYFDRSWYTTAEWSASMVRMPGVAGDRLVPVRVEEVPAERIPAILRPVLFRDIFGVTEEQARRALLEAVGGARLQAGKPVFPGPGSAQVLGGPVPRLPGRMPRVWNIPARNAGFTGRDGLLLAVRKQLRAGDQTVVQALRGLGGVGKTQIAVEYAHRFARTYDLAWWVIAEQPGLIGDQFAELAAELGYADARADVEAVRVAVLGELRQREGWLLVFDNAENPKDITRWLPSGTGHVLITSRVQGWAEVAATVEVDVLARPESIAMLRARVDGLDEDAAGQLAAHLGDLPLALAQAAGFMAETGMRAADYLELLGTKAKEILDQAPPVSYPRSLAAVTQLALNRLNHEDPGAAELASLCAFLAPEPIPESLFSTAAAELPADLTARISGPMAWHQTLGQLSRHALARVDRNGLLLHRLTQAILRDMLPPDQAIAIRARTEAILAAANPGDVRDPGTWPRWAGLIPHLLAADLAGTANPVLRSLACDVCCYLLAQGDSSTSHGLATSLYQAWCRRLGRDDRHTLTSARYIAWALWSMGRYAEARDLNQDVLTRRRRVLGEDHPDTLTSANSLALDLFALGDLDAAHELNRDVLARRRHILGEDDPETLTSASNLANTLNAMDQAQGAYELGEDILARRRRVLGQDHPDTLTSASNLAVYLRTQGNIQAARDLNQRTLARRRQILGEDHPDTLTSACNLAIDLRALGQIRAAHELDQDTYTRRRRVLGEDHPDTVTSAGNLTIDLDKLKLAEMETASYAFDWLDDECS